MSLVSFSAMTNSFLIHSLSNEGKRTKLCSNPCKLLRLTQQANYKQKIREFVA